LIFRKQLLSILLVLALITIAGSRPEIDLFNRSGTAEKTIKVYYDDLLQGDYSNAAQYIAKAQLIFLGLTREEYIAGFKEATSKNALTLAHYSVGEIKDIDATHKVASVFFQATANNKVTSGTDEFLVVLEDGQWKIDYSMTLRANPPKGDWSWNMHGGKLEISNLITVERPDALGFRFAISNNTNNTLKLGWTSTPQVRFITDQGTWSENSPYMQIDIGEKLIMSGVIRKASGTIKQISIGSLYFIDNNGNPTVTEGESISLNL
jgi:hypothetical protein